MNRFLYFSIVALLTVSFVQAQTKAAQSSENSTPGRRAAAEMGTGKWWMSLSDEQKDKFIERYAKAMNHAMSDLFADCADGLRGLPHKGAQDVEVESSMTVCKVASSLDFSFDRKELKEGVDEFYKEPTNLTVLIEVALQHVRDALAIKHPRASGGGIGTSSSF